jgi:hypothetical protein
MRILRRSDGEPPLGRLGLVLAWLALFSMVSGCAGHRQFNARTAQPFNFATDTFAYPNELVWEYQFDPVTGKATTRNREPPPTYSHHCFVVARAASQFLQHARFDPEQPVASEATYRKLVRQVLERSPRAASAEADRIVIPGYASLREFSTAWEKLLKGECGGAWRSYFQRGHWRMIFPFSRGHQEEVALALWSDLRQGRSPVVHVVRFPELTINHALLVFNVTPSLHEIRFDVYDPNSPDKPAALTFHRDRGRFEFPPTFYFVGGRVDVYEVYCGGLY